MSFLLPAAVLVFSLLPGVARAHAFAVRYDLPLPLDFYLLGAGAIVALSFLVMALAGRRASAGAAPLYLILIEKPEGTAAARRIAAALKTIGVLLFLGLLAVGFYGPPSPTQNLSTVTVWVLWWVGFFLFSALVVNAWPLLDPWRNLYALLPGRGGRLKLPAWLGCWPAVALLLAFIWMELVGDLGHEPRGLVRIVVTYSLIAWLLMAIFGGEGWQRSFDPFGRLFALLGRFAPIGRFDGEEGHPLVLRWPGAALLDRPSAGSSHSTAGQTAFLLVVLSSVTFDGFSETPAWAFILDWLSRNEALRPFLLWTQETRLGALGFIKSVALLSAPLLFAAVIWIFCLLSSFSVGGEQKSAAIFRHFAVTLLPIAIAYHLSHYASFLLYAGQLAIPLMSDPFGLGWDLFGTKGYVVDVGVAGAKDIWYLSLIAIVAGHVFAVVLGHVEALRLFSSRSLAVRSQIPLLILMVLFTFTSLWILAQPVIAS